MPIPELERDERVHRDLEWEQDPEPYAKRKPEPAKVADEDNKMNRSLNSIASTTVAASNYFTQFESNNEEEDKEVVFENQPRLKKRKRFQRKQPQPSSKKKNKSGYTTFTPN